MDEDEQQEAVAAGGCNPVVTVPAWGGTWLAPETVTAPLDVATQWDERIWRRA